MATDLFIRNGVPALWDPGAGTDYYFSLKDSGRAVTPGAETYYSSLSAGTSPLSALSPTVGTGAGTARTRASVAGPTAGILVGSSFACISPPLAADVTISGTISFAFCGEESSMNANATFRAALYRLDAAGALTPIINVASATELGTSLGRITFSGSPTSTAMKKGDRFLLLPMFDDAGGNMGSGFTLTLQVDGATASTADSKLTLTEDVTFLTSDPAGTSYYLRDTAASLNPGAATEKMLSQTQGSGTAEAVFTSVAGPIAFPGQQWTGAAGGTAVEWYTPELEAFTLGGLVMVELTNNAQFVESTQSDLKDALTLELAVVDADGTNPVIWARGYTSTKSVTNPKKWYVSGTDLAVAQGKRLRFRVYADDYLGPSGADAQVAGLSRTIRYDGTSTYASRLVFTQTLTEASGNVSGSGSAALGGAATAASGTHTPPTISGTGTVATGGAVMSGTGLEQIPGTGAIALGGAAIAASGAHTIPPVSGTGAAALDGIDAAGAGAQTVVITGTGTAGLGGAAVSASGSERLAGSGTAGLGGLASSGSGTERLSGSGAIALGGLASAGTALERIPGSGSAALDGVDTAAAGSERIAGGGGAALGGLATAGSAPGPITGTGSAALSGPATTASGTEAIPGTGSAALAPPGGSGVGQLHIVGGGGAAAAGVGASGAGAQVLLIAGAGAASLAGLAVVAFAGIPANTGTGTAALAGFGAAASGLHTPVPVTGTGAMGLGAAAAAGAGTALAPPVTGTGVIAVAAFDIAAIGLGTADPLRGLLRGVLFARPALAGTFLVQPSLAGDVYALGLAQGDVVAVPAPSAVSAAPALSGSLLVEV